jgi:pyrroline-5-carboxylate reductase
LASPESLISPIVSVGLAVALEGVEQGAVDAGLGRESARVFARQALWGTALLLEDVGQSPAALKDRVASPGGTTIAGLAALEDMAARGALLRSIEQAVLSSVEGRGK